MRAAGCAVHQLPLPDACTTGSFVAPTIIEIPNMASLKREVFGPVLHVLRYPRDGLDALIAAINATGYALTFGLHTRIDETVARVTAGAGAGNIYINRNLIGAVVGVQPFGGHGLSGTGPKAGGPLYLRRLLSRRPAGHAPGIGTEQELPGPVGERNLYATEARGTVLCIASDPAELLRQIDAALETGNRALITKGALADLPAHLSSRVQIADDPWREAFAAILFDGAAADLRALNQRAADRPGPVISVYIRPADGVYPQEFLVRERSISINTTAAGGNAHLMMIG
jgi:RHH-type proline utilization regulon transcriptional repressor/proline dehydrogenase/delta 1-pyrroline-5-carboxylate dehydrogenase